MKHAFCVRKQSLLISNQGAGGELIDLAHVVLAFFAIGDIEETEKVPSPLLFTAKLCLAAFRNYVKALLFLTTTRWVRCLLPGAKLRSSTALSPAVTVLLWGGRICGGGFSCVSFWHEMAFAFS